jgi:hypothetical protein
VEVTDLPGDRFGEASVVMADAFLDDPGWKAVGPDDPKRRHRYIRRLCRGVLDVTARRGGRIWQVDRDGRAVGVLSSLDPGQWPLPQLPALAAQKPGRSSPDPPPIPQTCRTTARSGSSSTREAPLACGAAVWFMVRDVQ